MNRFKCSYCGATINTPDDYAEEMAKCPECGHSTAIPVESSDKPIVEDHSQKISDEISSPEKDKDTAVPQIIEEKKFLSTTSIISILSFVIVLVCVVGMIYSIYETFILKKELASQKNVIKQATTKKGTILQLKEEKAELKKELDEQEKKLYELEKQQNDLVKQINDLVKETDEVRKERDKLRESIVSKEDEKIAELKEKPTIIDIDKDFSDNAAVFEEVVMKFVNRKQGIFKNQIGKNIYPQFLSEIVKMSFDKTFSNESVIFNFLAVGSNAKKLHISNFLKKYDDFYFKSIMHGEVELIDVKDISGTPSLWTGKAAYFDGNGYLKIPSMPLHLDGIFSISFWIKLTGVANCGIVEQKNSNSSYSWLKIGIIGNGNPYMSFHESDIGSSVSLDDDWHFLVFQYNTGTQEIWVDGKLMRKNKSRPFCGSGGQMYIGKAIENSQVKNFQGYIDDFSIYFRHLDHEFMRQIIAIKNDISYPKVRIKSPARQTRNRNIPPSPKPRY